ncbi:MAG: DUF5916 domain-containing protein [Thermoanaerobaculia bacterium]
MFRCCHFPLIVAFLVSWAPLAGQEGPEALAVVIGERIEYELRPATTEVKVDGLLDEQAWRDATVMPVRFEWFPGDNTEPPVKTEALVTYGERALYVAFRAYDPKPEQIRAHLMDRDQINTLVQDDYVIVQLDTFNDGRRAFQFRINPLGVQADAFSSEVEGIEDWSWDMIWQSKGRITAEGYEVEIAFPFNQLRFQATQAVQTWGMDVGRSYPRSSRHRMNNAGRDRNLSCWICQFNKVTGLQGLKPGRNLEFDPTVTAARTDELSEFPDGSIEDGEGDVEAGLTARWGITPSLVLTGTVNPDFSQVEADVAQLAVNERFALFYEEKRPFFLEGIDVFSTPFNSVYTRTVVAPDWGLKLTGKQQRNSVGVFAADDTVNLLLFPSNQRTDSTLLNESVSSGVLRYRRDVGASSSLGVIYTGREGEDAYHNRVGGIDGLFRVGDRDTIEFQYLYSDTQYDDTVAEDFDQPTGAFTDDAFRLNYVHDSNKWYWQAEYEDRGPGFRVDSGFIPRVDTKEAEFFVMRRFWAPEEDDWYDRWDVIVIGERTEDHEGQLTDEHYEILGRLFGPLQSIVNGSIGRRKEYYDGVLYEDLDFLEFFFEVQPSGAVKLEFFSVTGDSIDFSNSQPADEILLNPALEAKLGRHVNLRFDHTMQRLDVEGGKLFEANLSQARLIYNFNVRSFVRAIFQWQDLERDPDLYSFEVEPKTETLFTQLLFSYKLNARTVLFAGYSDNYLGEENIDLTQTNRTFFFKIGYAWVL